MITSVRRHAGNDVLQFGLFTACSGLAALTNIGVGVTLYVKLGFSDGMGYQASIVVAYLSGMLVNFFLNRHITFRNFSRTITMQGRSFFLVALVGLLLTVLFAYLFRSLFDAWLAEPIRLPLLNVGHEAAAHVLSVGLVAIYSFFGHKLMTFDEGIRARLRRMVAAKGRPQA